MLVSYNWLQRYFNDKLPNPEEISDGIIFHSFEVESVSKKNDDTIFDIKVLPDRAHDSLSHFGIARELSVIFDLPIKPEIKEFPKIFSNEGKTELKIKNEEKKDCRRYIGRIIKNVKVGPSPEWLRESLEAIGQKSINNIVDATNYVMFDLGNPIHAFDLDKLDGPEIIIRKAKTGEKIVTLDKKEVDLDEGVLVISDSKNSLAIAGIKGGNKAEVNMNTSNLVIEVANFDPVLIRKTSKKVNIQTDSSKRFENEISPVLAEVAMNRISNLILEVAGGELEEPVEDYEEKPESKKVIFTTEYLNKTLGIKIEEEEIGDILSRQDYAFSVSGGDWEVTVPFWRLDLNLPCDFAEEIGRIYGYEKIEAKIPDSNFSKNDALEWQQIKKVRAHFISNGYREVMTYSFTNLGEVEVLASASDKKFLRTNLSDGVKKSYELNKINLPLLGDDEIKIFEIGATFTKDNSASADGSGDIKEQINVCWADKNGVEETSLDDFVKNKISSELEFKDSESLLSTFNFQPSNYFKPWSQYPFITRDIAVWVPEETKPEELSKIYKEFGTELLISEPKLFDQFTKESRTSYAFRLVFQSYDKTLTDDEINVIMANIEEKISSLNWTVR
ncbi:MAG: phenylalanine--tRNA ligase subunit beta [Candidatus Pacebacteria bacterium]|nr:phenylalanine--tRNA ligase subunit beta [Candidatus Paceibacterota bacterium]